MKDPTQQSGFQGAKLGKYAIVVARYCLVASIIMTSPDRSVCATAAVIYDLDNNAIGAWIVREDANSIVFDEVLPTGGKQRREMARSEILRVLHSVSTERLMALKPENPNDYKQYAEELAEIQIDPEARPMAMRLYHIAAVLDPETLAESCLLAMARIAQDDAHRKRLRFAAYLHSQSGDRRALNVPRSVQSESNHQEIEHSLLLLEKLRTRQTYRFSDEDLVRLRNLLQPYADSLSDQQLREQIDSRCTHCRSGYNRCEECSGKGSTGRGANTQKCRHCNRGKVPCTACGTYFRGQALPEAFARQIVRAEVVLRRKQIEKQTPAARTTGDDKPEVAWSATIRQSSENIIPSLGLAGLTEHDPAECVFKSGRWVRP